MKRAIICVVGMAHLQVWHYLLSNELVHPPQPTGYPRGRRVVPHRIDHLAWSIILFSVAKTIIRRLLNRALSFSNGTGNQLKRFVGLGGEGAQGTGDVVVVVEPQQGQGQIAEQRHQVMGSAFA